MTFIELAREVAAEFGQAPSDLELGNILWNYTGYPVFFAGDVETERRWQLREFFADPQGVADRIEREMEDASSHNLKEDARPDRALGAVGKAIGVCA